MKKSTFIILGIALLIIIAIFTLGKKDEEKPPVLAILTGTVAYRERIALPKNALITIMLQDVSKMDTATETIAETTITTEGQQVPIEFSLEYDTNKIIPENTYSLSTKITVDDELLWINAGQTQVITKGNPVENIAIMLTKASEKVSTEQGTTISVPLEGTPFKVVAYNGKLAPTEGDYTVIFNKGQVQAKFCNSINGEYVYKDYIITAPTMMSTLMFCESPEGLMDIEQLFGKMLSEGAHVTISGDVLELATDTDTLIFQAK